MKSPITVGLFFVSYFGLMSTEWQPDHLSIKSWAEDDRPREKLAKHGQKSLSDAELLAIVIGSGSRKLTAVELSKQILHHSDQRLSVLSKKSLSDLQKFRGVGQAKAVNIIAALELGRRRALEEPFDNQVITSSSTAQKILKMHMEDLDHEEFWVLYMSRSNSVLEVKQISRGGITGTVADVRLIFKHAIQLSAVSIILSHNHPSGNLNPSPQDISLTTKMVEAGKILDISVLDHIILSSKGYYSFRDEGII